MKYFVEYRKEGAIGVFSFDFIDAESKDELRDRLYKEGYETGIIVTADELINKMMSK